MPGYIVVTVEITDPAAYQAYSSQVEATLEPYGGRFLVRGGRLEELEGEWYMPRLVVLEFPSTDAARDWYRSDAYQRILPIRTANSNARVVLVEGYTPPA